MLTFSSAMAAARGVLVGATVNGERDNRLNPFFAIADWPRRLRRTNPFTLSFDSLHTCIFTMAAGGDILAKVEGEPNAGPAC
jgi:hypothetical protein